jgi:hypothetical protein
MSSLNENTLLLQQLLTEVNELPEAGGGASNIAYGTFTIDSKVKTNTIAIEHGLGCTPDLVAVFTTTVQSSVANKGNPFMAFDAVAMRRYTPSSSTEISAAVLDGTLEDWANDTTFTLAYAYWYYGVGDHIWFAMKRGA